MHSVQTSPVCCPPTLKKQRWRSVCNQLWHYGGSLQSIRIFISVALCTKKVTDGQVRFSSWRASNPSERWIRAGNHSRWTRTRPAHIFPKLKWHIWTRSSTFQCPYYGFILRRNNSEEEMCRTRRWKKGTKTNTQRSESNRKQFVMKSIKTDESKNSTAVAWCLIRSQFGWQVWTT